MNKGKIRTRPATKRVKGRKQSPGSSGHPVWDRVIGEMNKLADAIRSGKADERFTVRRVKVVAGPPELSAADIKAIRESIGVSQPLFAEFLGVSPQVVKAWEQGRRRAVGAARRLLADMRDHAGHWRERVRETITP